MAMDKHLRHSCLLRECSGFGAWLGFLVTFGVAGIIIIKHIMLHGLKCIFVLGIR